MDAAVEESMMESFNIIAHAGDARSFAFMALQAAKKGDFEEADKLMADAEKASNEAHEGQTKLLFRETSGGKNIINVLLIHGQDHLMTAMLAIDLIKEMIDLYRDKK
ncbi:MAG: PTS lactose/cellobiose transporter subunit IIA [Holdemanella sp.]|nr:PTS lactose/cellobiose transporter subunit IIA [Holdemanella sp.]